MYFEYASVEDVFFEFGFFDEQVVVFEEVLDHGEMAERIILEVLQIFLYVVFHQLRQLVVNFKQNRVYLLVVCVWPMLL